MPLWLHRRIMFALRAQRLSHQPSYSEASKEPFLLLSQLLWDSLLSVLELFFSSFQNPPRTYQIQQSLPVISTKYEPLPNKSNQNQSQRPMPFEEQQQLS